MGIRRNFSCMVDLPGMGLLLFSDMFLFLECFCDLAMLQCHENAVLRCYALTILHYYRVAVLYVRMLRCYVSLMLRCCDANSVTNRFKVSIIFST